MSTVAVLNITNFKKIHLELGGSIVNLFSDFSQTFTAPLFLVWELR